MKKTLTLAFLAISLAAVAQQSGHGKINLLFTDADAAYVLQAISKQTGQQILYSNKAKTAVTINLSVDTVDEAIRAVDSAAGLMAYKVGTYYIVAPKDSMKDALAPFAHTTNVAVPAGFADKLVPKLTEAYPYIVARAIGDKISLTGTNQDIQDASAFITETIRAELVLKPTSDLVAMHSISAEEAASLIKGLYPDLQVSSTGASKAGAPAKAASDDASAPAPVAVVSYGFVGLRGPEAMVMQARETLEKMDTPANATGPNKRVVQVYNLKYANGPSLQKFLKSAEPEIEVFVGPEQFSPQRAIFNPLSSEISSGSAAGGSSSGGGGGSSSGGSASGGGAGGGAAPSGTAGATPGHGAVGDRAKAIVLKGRQADVDAAMKLVAELDVKPRQVVIEVKVIETSPTDTAALGVSYTFSPVNFYDIAPGSLLTNATGAVGLTAGTTQSLDPSHFSRTPLNFAATLNAMVSKQTAKLLATPNLTVIDNDQGSIFIGNTVSVELTSVGQLGATSQSIAQFPVGIILLVSPRIGPDGNVTIHVNPVVSTISSINANGIPQTSAREADTTMIIKDGETKVIGGLIQDQDTRTVTEVPFLSKLPIIGELFKNRTSTRNRSDILVSITPHIVPDDAPVIKK